MGCGWCRWRVGTAFWRASDGLYRSSYDPTHIPFVSSEVETPNAAPGVSTSGLSSRKFILSEVEGLDTNGRWGQVAGSDTTARLTRTHSRHTNSTATSPAAAVQRNTVAYP